MAGERKQEYSGQIGNWFRQASGYNAKRSVCIGGGGNSRIYRVHASDGNVYAAKIYSPGDNIDALERATHELSALKLMWDNGIRCVARPIGISPGGRMLVYSYISGRPVPKIRIPKPYLLQLTDFITQLAGLRRLRISQTMPAAREACFSLAQLNTAVDRRLHRLLALPRQSGEVRSMQDFLNQDFKPVYASVGEQVESMYSRAGIPVTDILAQRYRTLSPSDYGFHNALVDGGGRLIFYDFEYFGWDDPAKMIADYLLHPQTRLPSAAKRVFVHRMLQVFRDDAGLPVRLEAAYLIHGLKWCLLFLNEFIPQNRRRRQFAAVKKQKRRLTQSGQLKKAKRLLSRMTAAKQSFPFDV